MKRLFHWFCITFIIMTGISASAQDNHYPVITADNIGQLQEVMRLGRGFAYDFDLNPSHDTLVIASATGAWRYDYPALENSQPITTSDELVFDVAWNHDGSYLATVESHNLKVWNTTTWESMATLVSEDSAFRAVSWKRDGSYLAVSDEKQIQIWDVTTNTILKTLPQYAENPSDIEWSPDGKLLAIGGIEAAAMLWDSTTGESQMFTQHTSEISSFSWSPDSIYLSIGNLDMPTEVWNVQTHTLVYTGEAMGILASKSAWSSDGKILAIAFNGSLHLIATETWEVFYEDDTLAAIANLTWLDNQELLYLSQSTLTRLTIPDYQARPFRTDHYQGINKIKWHPTGEQIFLNVGRGKPLVWDLSTASAQSLLPTDDNTLFAWAWSPDGQQVALVGFDGNYIWDIPTQTIVQDLVTLSGDSITALAWSPTGQEITLGLRSDSIELLNPTTAEQTHLYTTDNGPIKDITWSPNERYLLIESGQNLSIWDMFTNEIISEIEGSEGVYLYEWSPDGQFIALSDGDAIYIWEMISNRIVTVLSGYDDYADSIAWSPDGQLLAIGSGDYIRIWNVETSESIAVLEGHQHVIPALAFSPDGTQIASASYDGTIRIWAVVEE